MAETNDLIDDLAGFARDAAYVVVGLGVLGFQRAQVRRVALEQTLARAGLEDRLAEVRDTVASGARQLDGALEGAMQFAEATLQPLEEHLPPAARELAGRAHAQARQVREQIHHLVTGTGT